MKMSLLGIGSLAALFVAWRALVLLFAVSVVVFKLIVFVVLPIVCVIWLARKLMRRGDVAAQV